MLNTEKNAIFVMDVSSSMEGERMNAAKKGALDFFENMYSEHSNFGLISFNQTPKKVRDLRNYRLGSKNQFEQGIKNLTCGGSTALWDSLGYAIDEMARLRKRGTHYSDQNIIIGITDGEDNKSKKFHGATDVEKYAERKGINLKIYFVGIDDSVDYSELKKLTSRTGGAFVPTGSDVGDITIGLKKVKKKIRERSPGVFTSTKDRLPPRRGGRSIHAKGSLNDISLIKRRDYLNYNLDVLEENRERYNINFVGDLQLGDIRKMKSTYARFCILFQDVAPLGGTNTQIPVYLADDENFKDNFIPGDKGVWSDLRGIWSGFCREHLFSGEESKRLLERFHPHKNRSMRDRKLKYMRNGSMLCKFIFSNANNIIAKFISESYFKNARGFFNRLPPKMHSPGVFIKESIWGTANFTFALNFYAIKTGLFYTLHRKAVAHIERELMDIYPILSSMLALYCMDEGDFREVITSSELTGFWSIPIWVLRKKALKGNSPSELRQILFHQLRKFPLRKFFEGSLSSLSNRGMMKKYREVFR